MSKVSGLTKESILKAVAAGAKNMTQIAHQHGFVGNVSGDVTKAIRKLVPKIGEILVDAKAGKLPSPEVPVPAVVVTQRKAIYKGTVYGKVFETAVQVGKEFGILPRKEVVSIVSRKTELTETQVTHALQVFATPNHQSNMKKSMNKAPKEPQGFLLLVPMEAVG